MKQLLDATFDGSFSKLRTEVELPWLPWVGSHYANSFIKLLIVGESHYSPEADPETADQQATKFMGDPEYTRKVVYECPIAQDWANSTYENIHKVIFETRNIDAALFWQEISFYNFISRVMHYHVKERPKKQEFYDGWKRFVAVARVLEPNICLFIGVAASNEFKKAMRDLGLKFCWGGWGWKISGTYSREATVTIDEREVRLVFIQHTSGRFSWRGWHEVLTKIMPDEIEHLSKIACKQR